MLTEHRLPKKNSEKACISTEKTVKKDQKISKIGKKQNFYLLGSIHDDHMCLTAKLFG